MKKLLPFLLLILASVPHVHADWTTDYKAALAQAKQQNKLVLLDFTGSDWCPTCQLLEKEVFSTPSFKAFVAKHFIPVTIDAPVSKKLSPALTQQNDLLSNQFKIIGSPTLLVVDADGKEQGRILGYDPGSGPKAVIGQLQKYSKP
jgi:thiol:disulfide interchange protein